MNLNRIQEAYEALSRLLHDNYSPGIQNQLQELGIAIKEASEKPCTYLHTTSMRLSVHWQQWMEDFGFAEKPYVRSDGLLLYRLKSSGPYYARNPDGSSVVDSLNRKRFWKYAITAMDYLDRDIPIK